MRFHDFERRARQLWEEIPDEYREGVDGLVISRDALPHPTLADIYTLGECHTESYPSDFGGPDTIRSVLVLYHGSFQNLAALDEAFDWEEELWETLTHELQHHLESLAAEAGLEDFDYAADERFKQAEGEPFDPYYYRAARPVAPAVWRLDEEFFLEIAYPRDRPPRGHVGFAWHGQPYRAPVPEALGDVCFLWLTGGVDTGPAALTLVLVRKPRLWDTIRALFRTEPPRVVDAEAEAERVAPGAEAP